MKWKLLPVIKIYEALGAVADKRIEMKGDSAIVTSSGRDKQGGVAQKGITAFVQKIMNEIKKLEPGR